MNFEKHTAKGNEFVNRLATRLGDEHNRDRAGRVMRCVLHVLRNRLSVEESFQLISQLPLIIKAIYVDGWTPGKHHAKIKTITEFAEEVMRLDGTSTWRDFSSTSDALDAIEAVMKTVADYVTAGELHDIIAVLPEDMKSYFCEWAHTP
ncbi:MAG TPA: DUF2267 domain-containing protein [Cytophagales bacterium]|jgi:uncharacterized protein (DUF2267 family)|nr:DUF2267 domain-containing protein [Cytophagales bacterium]